MHRSSTAQESASASSGRRPFAQHPQLRHSRAEQERGDLLSFVIPEAGARSEQAFRDPFRNGRAARGNAERTPSNAGIEIRNNSHLSPPTPCFHSPFTTHHSLFHPHPSAPRAYSSHRLRGKLGAHRVSRASTAPGWPRNGARLGMSPRPGPQVEACRGRPRLPRSGKNAGGARTSRHVLLFGRLGHAPRFPNCSMARPETGRGDGKVRVSPRPLRQTRKGEIRHGPCSPKYSSPIAARSQPG